MVALKLLYLNGRTETFLPEWPHQNYFTWMAALKLLYLNVRIKLLIVPELPNWPHDACIAIVLEWPHYIYWSPWIAVLYLFYSNDQPILTVPEWPHCRAAQWCTRSKAWWRRGRARGRWRCRRSRPRTSWSCSPARRSSRHLPITGVNRYKEKIHWKSLYMLSP